jgi:hypothetical protein
LKGFLDAFKADLKAFLALSTAADGPDVRALTQCEDFA